MQGNSSVLALFCALAYVCSALVYNIAPSPEGCNGKVQSCHTLSDFAAKASQLFDSNITVILRQGEHSIDSHFSIDRTLAFSMSSSGNTTIKCKNSSELQIQNISYVHLKNLKFRECQLTAQDVNSFFLAGVEITNVTTTFKSALKWSRIDANIVNSTFHRITANNSGAAGVILDIDQGNLTIQNSLFKECTEIYGVALLNVRNSNITVTESRFMNMKLTYGINPSIGGIFFFSETCDAEIYNCTFSGNTANEPFFRGGIINAYGSLNISSCYFMNNIGGAIRIEENVAANIESSVFINNSAKCGAAVYVNDGKINISECVFASNTALDYGGALALNGKLDRSHIICISRCILANNEAIEEGGALYISNGEFVVVDNTFYHNNAARGGALYADMTTINILSISKSNFTNNKATRESGGAIMSELGIVGLHQWVLNMSKCIFLNNQATQSGGGIHVDNVEYTTDLILDFSENKFIRNEAVSGNGGAIAVTFSITLIINYSDFQSNKAYDGGAIFMETSIDQKIDHQHINIIKSFFKDNVAINSGGAVKSQGELCYGDKPLKMLNITRSKFSNNTALLGGAIFAEPASSYSESLVSVYIIHFCTFAQNYAVKGGALYLTTSELHINGKTILFNNRANASGGGIYLHNSEVMCKDGGILNLVYNIARESGGGIYSWNSSVVIYFFNTYGNSSAIVLNRNEGNKGGGMYLSNDSMVKIFINKSLNTSALVLTDNSAKYGQDILVVDNCTGCYKINKCFIQLFTNDYNKLDLTHTIYFSLNQTNKNILKSDFSLCQVNNQLVNESEYLRAVSNIQYVNIGSLSIKFALCHNGSPDLTYHALPISRKKFSVQVALFDQFGHAVRASIKSHIDDGSILSHQRNQKITAICAKLNFTVFSSSSVQVLIMTIPNLGDPYLFLSPDQIKIPLTFRACISCPIGFEKSFDEIKGCECVCNTIIKHFLIACNASSGLITKQHTTAWISYIIHQNSSNFLIYPYCPLNYCFRPNFKVEMNLNQPNGADAQCAHNRSGLLCGACSPGLSLSLGSSHCIPCSSQWPGTLVAIIIGSIFAGIILVAIILVFNLTVAVGTINGLIFYANIAAANYDTFFLSTSIFSIINAWMNLEVGIDTCLFEGMDAYMKVWVELAFPMYVIFLITLTIIMSEKSMKFARLIGHKNPVATLDTLILLLYVKFIRIIISTYSFAILDYPDGSRPIVWLPDATVYYFSGKHVVLFIVATILLLLGIAYTMLLFFWQWLLYYQNKKILFWIRNQRLCMFLEPYHAPYSIKHRYWTGLLLFFRIGLYITSSVTTSRDPRITLVITEILAIFLLILSTHKIYKQRHTKLLEVTSFLNITLVCTALLYFSRSDKGQEIATYISGSTTLALLIIVLLYHFVTEICLKINFGRMLRRKIEHRLNDRNNNITLTVNLISNDTPLDGDQGIVPTYSIVDPPTRNRSLKDNEEKTTSIELKVQSAVECL